LDDALIRSLLWLGPVDVGIEEGLRLLDPSIYEQRVQPPDEARSYY
jgi:hypothetical protein